MFDDWLVFHHRLPEYGLEVNELDLYRASMALLARDRVVWPDPMEAERYGGKLELINNLDTIARQVTRTARPVTKHLRYGDPIPGQDWVMKRGHSSHGNHVYLPNRAEDRLKRDWNYIRREVDHDRRFATEFWFKQTFNPILLEAGELRTFYAGGVMQDTIRTIPIENLSSTRGQNFDVELKVNCLVSLAHVP